MHSIASVRSASGAASYFASDNYYTIEGSSEMSVWAGEGATALGLDGAVSKEAFEGILNGVLPTGEDLPQTDNRRAGFDLTFSMPKSASVMAYVAGDKRILPANANAVRATMTWIEKNLAEGRKEIGGRSVPTKTGNLVYALFQHDTSRALDPQGHIHAVVANLTKMADGKWQALHADKIWSNNIVIGSIYHAFLRAELEKLGYRIDAKGKHGAFEIAGVPKAVNDAFSQRRGQILAKASELGVVSKQGLREITEKTRDPKLNVDDRDALHAEWKERSAALGFDGKTILTSAEARAAKAEMPGRLETGMRAVADAMAIAKEALSGFLQQPHDPLVDRGLVRLTQSPAVARSQLAVASAVRILSEREAAFPAHQLAKTALDLNLPGVTVNTVEARIRQLTDRGQLIMGFGGKSAEFLTTKEALRTEERILEAVDRGAGKATPIVPAAQAPERLQAASAHDLNAGQLGAAALIIGSADRTVIVQGVAGAGKSTMLNAVARVAEAEGRQVRGLAFQNKMVADLAEGAGIEAQTIASFVLANERYVTERDTPGYAEARGRLEGAMLVVDETSMVSSSDTLKLHQIVEALGVDKLVLVGDRQQLSSIDAGKAFAMIQAGGGTMARMDDNLRQRTDTLKTVAALANVGKAGEAMKVLGDHVVESASPAEDTANRWLGLSPEDRAATAVFASGREYRAIINQRIQDGLAAEGSLKGEGLHLTVYERVNTTREELRYAATYRAGMTLDVGRGGAGDIGLKGGRYDVVSITPRGKVELSDGKKRIWIDPQKLSPLEKRDRLQLAQKKDIHIREGDRIRWTANDKKREIHNAAVARVLAADAKSVTLEMGDRQLTLAANDPMLSRIDLAYSLNMHMAQGITTDKAITVMSSQERFLANQRLFNVGVTRVRDELTMVVDDKAKLERQLNANPGDKTSALETVGRLDIDAKPGSSGGGRGADRSVLDKIDLGKLGPSDSAGPARGGEGQGKGHKTPPDIKIDINNLPPLPERSLGLDL